MGTTSAIAGCLGSGAGDSDTTRNTTENTTESEPNESAEREGKEEEEEEIDPREEADEHDGTPHSGYDLENIETFEAGQPVWLDHNERLYGRDDQTVIVSDDWWQSHSTLYDFVQDPNMPEGERVETVVVPESGEVLVGLGGNFDETTGRVVRLIGGGSGSRGYTGSEVLHEFEWGRTSNSIGHVTYEDIVVFSCYEGSDFPGGKHANEVIVSSDGGRSFERVLKAELHDHDAANLHIHDVEYDPYAERIWVAVGDHGNAQIYWSDDLGESWEIIGPAGSISMVTQVAAFEDCVVLGTDGYPEGILRWERDGPNDAPEKAADFVRPHVQIETESDTELMEMYARRRWHIREEDGRELCLMPFGYSPMNEDAKESVVLASVNGDEWYELYRTQTREILLTNVMGPLSMDGDQRTLISDSNQGEGHQITGTVPEFW